MNPQSEERASGTDINKMLHLLEQRVVEFKKKLAFIREEINDIICKEERPKSQTVSSSPPWVLEYLDVLRNNTCLDSQAVNALVKYLPVFEAAGSDLLTTFKTCIEDMFRHKNGASQKKLKLDEKNEVCENRPFSLQTSQYAYDKKRTKLYKDPNNLLSVIRKRIRGLLDKAKKSRRLIKPMRVQKSPKYLPWDFDSDVAPPVLLGGTAEPQNMHLGDNYHGGAHKNDKLS